MVEKHTRREWLKSLAALPVAMGATVAGAEAPVSASFPGSAAARVFPDKDAFGPMAMTYLDSGSQHPLSLGARRSLERYLAKRALDPAANYPLPEDAVREKFARLINADPEEIAYVPSTTAGEHLVIKGLGLPARGTHVVTDTLHFFGSFYLYQEMAKRGVEVTWLRPVDGRISLEAVERAVRRGTRLVALSAVSTYNGFEHDVKHVCEIAHAKGALVYADIVHAAGCIPFDVKATGVDFAACASYKWLMGDFGLGFLYVRRDLWERFQRSQWGYYALEQFQTHVYPFDPPGSNVADYATEKGATGLVALGTHSHTCIAMLDHSLDYLLATGVERIQAHAQTLTGVLKQELPRLGYALATPPESRAPIVTCVLEGAREKLFAKLDAAKIRITIAKNRFRVTPSVFNDRADVDRL
ncbi:MAG TPA: aminotransferase class V-fold PLP-dependent enzyme, partial [Steroidobacteraceae bacterium]|nr:aminotransferase class V-fold PLP-dependent enzyme [Steroidobacteraceae bacterium]